MDAFQHGSCAAVGINRAVDPRIAVVAHHHPLIGILGASDFASNIPDGPVLVILFQMQLHLHRAGAYVVGKGQSALPIARRFRPSQVLQDRLGIAVRKRSGRNLGHIAGLVRRDPLGIRQ